MYFETTVETMVEIPQTINFMNEILGRLGIILIFLISEI